MTFSSFLAFNNVGVKNRSNNILNSSAIKNGWTPSLNIGFCHPINVPSQIIPRI